MKKKKVKPPPPRHLSDDSQRLWKDVMSDSWNFHPLQREVLQSGLESRDLCRTCMAKIFKDGLLIQSGKTMKPHPLLRTLKEARTLFLRAMAQLRFDVAEEEDKIQKEDIDFE